MSGKAAYVRRKNEEKPVETKPENEYLEELQEIQRMDSIRHPEKHLEDKDIPNEETETGKKKSAKERPDAEKKAHRKSMIPDYEFLFNKEAERKGGKAGAGILLKLLRENIKQIIISLFLWASENPAAWAAPLVTASIVNLATNPVPGGQKRIIIYAVVLILVTLTNIPTCVWYSRYIDKVLRTVGAGLRNTLVKKLQHLSITYHKEIETGRIQAKFLRDIETIEVLNTRFVKMVVPTIINLVIYMVITVVRSPIVTLFFFVIVPINVGIIYAFRKRLGSENRQFRQEAENVSAKVTTMLDMLPVTKAHGLEETEIVSVSQRLKHYYAKALNLDRTNALFGSSLWVVSQVMSMLCLAFTASLALYGKIQVGDIVLFQTFFNSISGSIQSLLNIYPELAKGVESARSLSEIMVSDDVEDNKHKLRLRYVHGTIDFEKVYYRYPNTEHDIIKDFSLHVEPGECVAFVGSSGSGKSTIMNMIIGFLKPTSGKMSIDGKPIDTLNLSDYRQHISVVPQNSILFNGTIKENILYGLDGVDDKTFEKVIEQANIKEFLDTLPDGVNTVVGESGDKLSGGQKQRISIARALIRDPQLLILDEATSALDNISEYQVQKAISHLIKDRTTFIVAHRLSTIRDADRIVVMEEGSCVEMGTYDELMAKKGKFYELKNLSDLTSKATEEL